MNRAGWLGMSDPFTDTVARLPCGKVITTKPSAPRDGHGGICETGDWDGSGIRTEILVWGMDVGMRLKR
jgi:hypothetical protein